MYNIGLLGAGRIGQVHAATIANHRASKLVAISDINQDAASELAQQYQCAARSTEDIISDPTIDAVLIATSTDTHADIIKAATDAGKPILCEKPVDIDLKRARQCLEYTKSSTEPIMIGFNRRFDPNFAAVKNAILAGEIGNVELLAITSFDPAPPPISYIKVSGGLFRDMMIHDFDMANFMMGEAPVSIHAVGSSLVDEEIGKAGDVDTAVVTLTYADGRIAVIKNSRRAAYGYDQRLEVLGSKGLLQAQNITENSMIKSTTEGVISAKPTYFFLERYMAAYAIEWEAFINALQNQTSVPVSLADGIQALVMAEAAKLSYDQGVTINLKDI